MENGCKNTHSDFLLDEIWVEGKSCGGSIPLRLQCAESVLSPAKCRDKNSYAQRIAVAEWIFSRAEGLLLAATATTIEMPGGMVRLIHKNEYTQVCGYVQYGDRK
jgi:hypothetical protein